MVNSSSSSGPCGLCCKVRVIGEPCALDEARGWRMNDFKGRHFEGEIVL